LKSGKQPASHGREKKVTTLQFYFAIGIPFVTILASMTISLFQMSGVRDDIREIRTDIKIMTGKIADIDTRISLIEDRWKIRP
jgi:hypothetical protein